MKEEKGNNEEVSGGEERNNTFPCNDTNRRGMKREAGTNYFVISTIHVRARADSLSVQ